MVKKVIKEPPRVKRYSDCAKCRNGTQDEQITSLYGCDYRITPQPNCLVNKIKCIYYKPR